MTDRVHKFKVGQIVDLVASGLRRAAVGHYEIIDLRPVEDKEIPHYRIKSRGELHERVVAEDDLLLPAHVRFD